MASQQGESRPARMTAPAISDRAGAPFRTGAAMEAALQTCLAGLARQPDDSELLGLAAEMLIAMRRTTDAAPYLYRATRLDPQNGFHWHRLYRLLQLSFLGPDERVRAWLIEAIQRPQIRTGDVVRSIANTLCLDPAISDWIRQAGDGALQDRDRLEIAVNALSADRLLITLMASVYIPNRSLESLFTALRRALLANIDEIDAGAGLNRFGAALASQAFLTDYAWSVSAGEEAVVNRLATRLEQAADLAPLTPRHELLVALVGAYRPLNRLPQATALANAAWSTSLTELVRIQLREPLEEQALRRQLPELTPVSDPVSIDVRNQYEENPFPRWHHAGLAPAPMSLPDLLRTLGGVVPDDPGFAAPDVLIAGCGTGQQSVTAASNYRDSRVLAIDLSLSSLAYAARRTRELGIDNIEYVHGDFTELARTDRKFHAIECTGVLVCVDDPLEAWRTLTDRLHRNGLMYIALYSELARRAVVMAREQIRREGYTPSVADMRRYRQYILDLPADHPLASLRVANDMYNISELRDYLFHVQEHRFTIPQIGTMLDRLGLRFLGFNIDHGKFSQRFPDEGDAVSLARWHAFEQENPDTFIGMYQFFVQKR